MPTTATMYSCVVAMTMEMEGYMHIIYTQVATIGLTSFVKNAWK
jgi:hypothetical protein